MDSKRWLACFLATVLLLGAAVVGFNYWVDPFGVFSHKSLEWPSYEMTINPRTAKITYLKDHHQDYDSYILGCSSTSSFPVESLNSYLDASFYNMIMYGADMLDVEEQAFYLVENYEVKNLVVNVYLDNAKDYNTEPDPLSYAMPPETTGKNAAAFLSKYLFMDPRHSLDKLKALRKDTYLTQTFDVFDPVTGAYDKKVRDAEPIGNMDRYLEAYPVFANYPEATNTTNEEAITGTLESLTRIRDLCQENGINLIVLCAPVYADYMDYFSWDQVADFYTRLAQVTPYWDFSYSSVSFEPRYFYDETHFRNCVGEMALARIFGDDSLYIPDDFGVYVTSDNVQEHLADMAQAAPLAAQSYTAEVPVLMYHHIDQEGNDSTAMTPALFEAQIAALAQAGYTAVFPDDLAAYVNQGKALPDKPIVITFDDGYYNNYYYVYPLLQKYNMKAVISVVGKMSDEFTGSGDRNLNYSHLTWDDILDMHLSGYWEIQNHSYDCHTYDARNGVSQVSNESDEDYRTFLTSDICRLQDKIAYVTGVSPTTFTYPFGAFNENTDTILKEIGFKATLSCTEGVSTIKKGDPGCLYKLKRHLRPPGSSPQEFFTFLN